MVLLDMQLDGILSVAREATEWALGGVFSHAEEHGD
jgi:hypothetical protein